MDRRDRVAIGVVGIASLVILLLFSTIAYSQRALQHGAGPDAVQEA